MRRALALAALAAALLAPVVALAITQIESSKLNTFIVVSPPAGAVDASKLVTYVVIESAAGASKLNTYVVVTPCSVDMTAAGCNTAKGFFRSFP